MFLKGKLLLVIFPFFSCLNTDKNVGQGVRTEVLAISDEFKIERTQLNSFYKYYFSALKPQKLTYLEDSIPVVEYLLDTLYDVNGDGTQDLLVKGSFSNGQCTPVYAMLFCLDNSSNKFIAIEKLYQIPNPKFFPSEKRVTGDIVCQMKSEHSEYIWDDLKLQRISSEVMQINDDN